MKIYYLGHSGWAVETDKRYLLFDVQDENIKTGGKLTDGFVDVSLLQDKRVHVFFSHSHHDHYSLKLHEVCKNTGLLGGHTIQPRERYESNGITVYTGASTDEGVCFLVRADGKCVFHAGDNADWGDGAQNQQYYREIDYLAGLGISVDAAFIPVCTYSGQRPEEMTKGAIYAVRKLAPGVVFPMHGNGREYLYEAFKQDIQGLGLSAAVVCVKKRGVVTR